MNNIIKFVAIFIMVFSILNSDTTLRIGEAGMQRKEADYGAAVDNIVNVKTPGYKYFKFTHRYDEEKKKIMKIRRTIFTIGPNIRSDRTLDFMLDGPGFFVLEDSIGNEYFTRDGRFEIDENNYLVTVSGKHKVMADDGRPITIMSYDDFKVDQDGNVYDVNNNLISKFKVIQVEDYKKLRTVNNVFFYILKQDDSYIVDTDEYRVKQGYYEGSNVNSNIMLARIANTGQYGANTQLIQTRLKMIDTIIDIAKQQ